VDDGWPIAPMLARLTRELPREGFLFEPKWDGFRCLARRSDDEIDLRSRTGRPLSRYFPEIVTALAGLSAPAFTVDGELMVMVDGQADFADLMSRLHPAPSRVATLARETPASFMLFDLLEVTGRVLMGEPFAHRRRLLEEVFGEASAPLFVTAITDEASVAAGWLDGAGHKGIDGVVAKQPAQPYVPGKRTMLKVKPERTADCVVAGFRLFAGEPAVASLLLGLYDGERLRHVGVVASFPKARRRQLVGELTPAIVALHEHPWRDGFALEGGPIGRLPGAAGRWTPDLGLDWVPLRPERVVEVAYDQVDGVRFRHPARFVRWRPDRRADSCTVDQLEEASWRAT
jgi:ATP-dependent DNA ligase